jgi:hypothetical protein
MKTTVLTTSTLGDSDRPTSQLKKPKAIAPGTPLQVMGVAQGYLEMQALRQCTSLQGKLAVFDPLAHGGEAMQDQPQGAEFGANLTCRNV